MKKIRLNVADMEATEILSREQLKFIFGGSGSGSGSYVSCGEVGKAYCGNTQGKSCKSGDKIGSCGVKTAETQCRCIVD